MSDEKLRVLKASWRASGSVEDEASWLIERVRVGELGETHLAFSAYCGSAPAAAACVALGIETTSQPERFQSWTYLGRTGLSRKDQFVVCLEVAKRASTLADQRAEEAEKIGIPKPDSTGRAHALADARVWVTGFVEGETGAPLPRRRLSANSPADLAAKALQKAVRAVLEAPLGNSPEVALAESLRFAAEVLGEAETVRVAGGAVVPECFSVRAS